MSEKMVVGQNEGSRFMIVYHDLQTDIETFFGGFCNEVECPGTDDESFSWEMERWVDRPEDGAVMFKTLREAKDFMDVLDKRSQCHIILYGQGEVENAMLGSHWYPLKTF